MMRRFPEFLALAKKWPGNYVIRVASCRLEYEACLVMGMTEDEIIAGTENWLRNHVPEDTSDCRFPAPHTFLAEQSFLAYQPEENRLRVVPANAGRS